MRTLSLTALAAVLFAAGGCSNSADVSSPQASPTTATPAANAPAQKSLSEKEKAQAEPFANDAGPATVDVSGYPADAQAGYTALQAKCTECHTAARPLNSHFVETSGSTKKERATALVALKQDAPQLFKDKYVWKIEANIWSRYVKRMMSKPGCSVTRAEGKVIWKFLAHDSRVRKIGKNTAKWKKHRQGLLDRFKKDHPQRYQRLYRKH